MHQELLQIQENEQAIPGYRSIYTVNPIEFNLT